jgi:hypothetical protein
LADAFRYLADVWCFAIRDVVAGAVAIAATAATAVVAVTTTVTA